MKQATSLFALALLAGFCHLSGDASAQAPAGYYDTVDTTNGATLRATLHAVIDDHQRFPYTSTATDTWNILELADEDPTDSGRILDVYRNASYAKEGGGNTFYNREHAWPKSYGFPNDVTSNYPYTDCHHLFLADDGYNSSRSNKPYRYCDAACSENPTDFNFGQGGGTGFYPGNSNWTSGSLTTGTWEVWINRRGDMARALLYMDVRYEGGTHGITGHAEPDLILTDDEALIASSNTGANESVGYMGMLSVLLQWHLEDPVDALELWRNDQVYSFQGNRNPFIDHPEWVDCIFNGTCGGDTTPPAAPTGLVAFAGTDLVDLDWNDNGEGDLAGYHVYRSTTSGGAYGRLTTSPVSTSAYSDTTAVGGTTYFYVVTAVDTSNNESGQSAESSATPSGGGGGPAADPWINELHYDNSGTDVGEFVEVAGPAGLDLSGWQVIGYNGNGGGTYQTISLSGTLPDQGGCTGTLSFAFASMQNGSPDGLALVDAGGQVVEFISYEGSLLATAGPANGTTSTDIGVAETTSTPIGESLQRAGTGSAGTDFTWQAPQAETPGLPNTGQVFSGGCGGGGGPVAPAAPTGLGAAAGDSVVDLSWNANGEPDVIGYDVYRSTTSGGGYVLLNGALVAGTSYSDTTASNGTTYFYVVTASDSEGLESAFSAEVSATPQDTTAPAAPTGLSATAGAFQVDLDWNDNGEPDLAGYRVYRATSSGGPYAPQTGALLGVSAWTDTNVSAGTTYFYVVTAEDGAGNESADSGEASATPTGGGGGGPTVLTFDDFESGFGNWTDGGGDCALYTGGTHAWQGSNAIDIQDNSGTRSSFSLTNAIDVATPGYTSIEVSFHYKGVGMETGEDFFVEYFDGASWQIVAAYVSGTDFQNNQFVAASVTISEASHTFPTNMRIRFRCDASANADDVYIDTVTISAQ